MNIHKKEFRIDKDIYSTLSDKEFDLILETQGFNIKIQIPFFQVSGPHTYINDDGVWFYQRLIPEIEKHLYE